MRKHLQRPRLFRPALRKAAPILLALPLLSCVPHNNTARKQNAPKTQQKTEQPPGTPDLRTPGWLTQVTPECTFEGNNLYYRTSDGFVKLVTDVFEPGETMIDAGCKSRYAFILTGKRLLMINGLNTPPPQGYTDEVAYIKIDVGHILAKGFVAWTQSEENAFILTSNRELRTIFADLQHDIYVHDIPFDVTDARLAYFSDYVHIGTPAGNLYSISPADDRNFAFKISPIRNPVFSVEGDTLLFGTLHSPEVAIRIGQDGNVAATEK